VALEEAANRAVAKDEAFVSEPGPQFGKRDVRRFLDQPQDHAALRLDASRATVTAKRSRPHIPLLALQLAPTADARSPNTEPIASLTMAQALRNSGKNANPKIERKRLRHARRPPPADSMNHFQADLGMPIPSGRVML
jgi:hypothetical protein